MKTFPPVKAFLGTIPIRLLNSLFSCQNCHSKVRTKDIFVKSALGIKYLPWSDPNRREKVLSSN